MEENQKDTKFENLVFCGGLGDLIALDSAIDLETKRNIKKIIILNKSESDVYYKNRLELLRINNHYNSNVEFCPIYIKFEKQKYYGQFTNYPVYFLTKKIKKELGVEGKKTLFCFRFWKKYFLNKLYKEDNTEIRKKNSYYYSETLENIEKFGLPNNYWVIVGWSRDNRPNYFNFKYDEWIEIKTLLEKNKVFGVLLNKGERDKIPNCKYFINLIGQTNYLEALEITKKASGYIGINGSLSILPMLKNPKKCFIKCSYNTFSEIIHKKYYSNVKNSNKIMFNSLTAQNCNINFN